MFWLLLLINVTVLAIEAPSLVKNRMYRELKVFSFFFVVGLYFGLAFYFHWPLQGPFNALVTHVHLPNQY